MDAVTRVHHEPRRAASRPPSAAAGHPGDRPLFEREGHDWPLRAASRFVEAAGIRWHVQILGAGPPVLLVHGTGAATHSWRGLAPLLAERLTVVAPDLPGHGFTAPPPPRLLSLPGMAGALVSLVRALDVAPALAIGHSAGAAVLARMSLDREIAPRCLIALNGALLPLHGLPGHLFSPVAKLLARTTIVPRLFARRAAEPEVVERILRGTGSRLDPQGVDLYRRLAARPAHVGAALGMMARWELEPLARDLPRLAVPLVLVAAGNDRTIRPSEAWRVRRLVPLARVEPLPGLGHLAHEEDPLAVARLVLREAVAAGVLSHG